MIMMGLFLYLMLLGLNCVGGCRSCRVPLHLLVLCRLDWTFSLMPVILVGVLVSVT